MLPMDTQKIEGKRLAWLLTLLYCASYVTRINYAASLQAIITATGFPKSELAVIAVLSESVGWRGTVGVWSIISLIGMGACLLATHPWKSIMIGKETKE